MRNWRYAKRYMIQSKLLLRYNGIDHAFLGRLQGNELHNDYVAQAASAEQIHGNSVAVVSQFAKKYDAVDGLVSTRSGSLLVRTADCLPILLFDPSRNLIAAIHAGCKGLTLNIIAAGVATMRQLGGKTRNIVAVIGPHIGSCCYAVTQERVEPFVRRGFKRAHIVRQSDTVSYLNLAAIARQQLGQAGISARQIEISGVCTHCDQRFYSYRREGKNAGRNLSVIVLQ